MSLDPTVRESEVEKQLDDIDKKFRLNFSKEIKEIKLKTHLCQFKCYNSDISLLDAESCSRNCFQPFLHVKKNATILIENNKEVFEKCKTIVLLKQKQYKVVVKEMHDCLLKYQMNLNSNLDEIKYIYQGYMKNFDTLINDEYLNLIKKDNKI